ncbi:MAG: RNA ligase family protein [Pseudanabaena sp. ELA748]
MDPYFDKFTDIQNGRIFTTIFQPGEEVVASEKFHGCNCRVGLINGHKVAGSMELRRSPPKDGDFSKSTYWFPWSIPGVPAMLESLAKDYGNVVELFGEVYGNSIQKGFKYDAGGGVGFKAFGSKVGNRFLDWSDFESKCLEFGVPVVSVLYRGPFDADKILSLIEGRTTMGEAPVMEGTVVVPVKERCDPKIGRVALKYISIQYDLLKNRPDCKDV